MLYVHYHRGTGKLHLRFDEEGRDVLLNRLKWAVRERDHEFFCPDIGAAGESSLPREWMPCDFVNIICHPEDEASLCIGEGVEITGGSIALAALAEQVRMLPEKGGDLYL